MIFVIGEDDKGNVIVSKASSVGKSDQINFAEYTFTRRCRRIHKFVNRAFGVEIKKNNRALGIPKRKSKNRIRIQTRQQGGTLKYKRYELRIYSRSLKSQENQIWDKK